MRHIRRLSMDDKMLRISGELHKTIKVRAAMLGVTIREFTENALRHELNDQRLVDTREGYTTRPYSIDPRYDCNPNETD